MNEPEHSRQGDQGGGRVSREPAKKEEVARERPHLLSHMRAGLCERCGTDEHVHEGLCRHCRKVLVGEGKILEHRHEEHPHQAADIPLRNPPWRRRGA